MWHHTRGEYKLGHSRSLLYQRVLAQIKTLSLTYKDAKNSYVSYIVKRFDLNQAQFCSGGSKEKLEMHVPQNCFNFILEKIEAA
jgi:hypothetical protein